MVNPLEKFGTFLFLVLAAVSIFFIHNFMMWRIWSRGLENRFGYRFYSLGVFCPYKHNTNCHLSTKGQNTPMLLNLYPNRFSQPRDQIRHIINLWMEKIDTAAYSFHYSHQWVINKSKQGWDSPGPIITFLSHTIFFIGKAQANKTGLQPVSISAEEEVEFFLKGVERGLA